MNSDQAIKADIQRRIALKVNRFILVVSSTQWGQRIFAFHSDTHILTVANVL